MRVILLVVVMLGVIACSSRGNGAPAAVATPAITAVPDCEAKKRAFVEQIPQMTERRQPPQGMFISGGAFPPDLSILVVEGNGLWAQVLYDRATGRATAWNVLCK